MTKTKQIVKPKIQKIKKPNENIIECEAIVVEVLPDTNFRVKLKDFASDELILVRPAGRMRTNHIKIIKGDHVKVELSTYDLKRGRITFRHRTPPDKNKD